MNKYIILATSITAMIVFPIGLFLGKTIDWNTFYGNNRFISPLVDQIKDEADPFPLLKYSIDNLQAYNFQASSIRVIEIIEDEPDYISYLFSYQTLGKTMTGQLNIPKTAPPTAGYPVVVMLRGWVPVETYTTGTGTKSAAAVFAKNGYVTLAPDFFDYGGSEAEDADTWAARFQKPISVIELLKTIEKQPQIETELGQINLSDCLCDKFIWAHSNGGQIALAALEISGLPIKTSLWAPVTAPFPYSILFFSDEVEDEGKEARKWVSLFEDDYDVFDFSITQHLDKLQAPLQIHQGTMDDAVPLAWNDEFVQKIKLENDRRATDSASLPIEINYFKYPGANHNLQPGWDTAVQRDLVFFEENKLQ